MKIDQVIEMLRRRQQEFSRADLEGKRGTSEYHYGMACGTFQAYDQMLADIVETLEAEKREEKRRESDQ